MHPSPPGPYVGQPLDSPWPMMENHQRLPSMRRPCHTSLRRVGCTCWEGGCEVSWSMQNMCRDYILINVMRMCVCVCTKL